MATKTVSLITSRDPKGLAITGLFEVVLNKAKLDEDQAQLVFEHGGEVQSEWLATIRKFATPNQFADEEVSSSYGYPNGYRIKDVNPQGNILRQFFPGIGLNDEPLASRELPSGAEGYFVIPRWEKVAPTYGQALEGVLELLKQQRKGKFKNWREGQLGSEYLRLCERTSLKLKALGDSQSAFDLLVVPAQFGLRHRGRSVRRAREVFTSNEFGLGPFEVGCMLLTHPERLGAGNELWIDCTGAEYSPDADGRFECCPFFGFSGGQLKFVSYWFGPAGGGGGSASAFFPQ